MSGIWPPNSSKLAITRKDDNDIRTSQYGVIVNFSWHCRVSLVKFSYWPKFHVNIITGSSVMTILLYKGLTRNPEIGNTPIWVLPNTWRLGRFRDTTSGTNVYNEMLLNAAKCQGYNFYRFWVSKGKTTSGLDYPPPYTHTHTRTPRLLPENSRWLLLSFMFSGFIKWEHWLDLHNQRGLK